MIQHPIDPVYDERSRVLILGSFPSVKSREMGFFYGHPQNRYWKVLARLMGTEVPMSVAERRAFLLEHRLAAWDVIGACDITGSADSTIRNVRANDLTPLLERAPIQHIYANGQTAAKLFAKYTQPLIGRPCICLPSTSPANAAWSLERLLEAWSVILTDLR